MIKIGRHWVSVSLGLCALIIALVYLSNQTAAVWRQMTDLLALPALWRLESFAIPVYAFLLIVPALAWGRLLKKDSTGDVSWLAIVRVYSISNLLKYLPGGVAHFGGRQLLGARRGWRQADLAIASALEVILMVAAAAFVAFLMVFFGGFFVYSPAECFQPDRQSRLLLCTAAAVSLTAIPIAAKVAKKMRGQVNPALALFSLFFVGLSLLTAGFLLILDESSLAQLLTGSGLFLLAWIIGFLVPGAPGGLGIREAAFVMFYAPFSSDTTALLVALLMRLATTGGDILLAGVISLAEDRKK